jgi:osmotically-inducible protein OsmY
MKSALTMIAVGALALFGGCSKQSHTTNPPDVTPGVTYEAPKNQSVFAKAWDSVVDGAKDVEEAGEWTVSKAKDGAVIVARKTAHVAGKAVDETGDAAVHAAVAARLKDAGIPTGDVNIDVKEGDVTLRGNVHSRMQAVKAVQAALDTTGVDKVTSYLTWS